MSTHYCEICERDADDCEERGVETLGAYWVCADCAASEPCDACDGEHHRDAPCTGPEPRLASFVPMAGALS